MCECIYLCVVAMKTDRKRLKAEKGDLVSQMQQLYTTLESREDQLREFIRNYDQHRKVTHLLAYLLPKKSSTSLAIILILEQLICYCSDISKIVHHGSTVFYSSVKFGEKSKSFERDYDRNYNCDMLLDSNSVLC